MPHAKTEPTWMATAGLQVFVIRNLTGN